MRTCPTSLNAPDRQDHEVMGEKMDFFKVLLTTKLYLLGRGLPIDSKVFLPIIIVFPDVSSLNFFISSAMCQGSLLSV